VLGTRSRSSSGSRVAGEDAAVTSHGGRGHSTAAAGSGSTASSVDDGDGGLWWPMVLRPVGTMWLCWPSGYRAVQTGSTVATYARQPGQALPRVCGLVDWSAGRTGDGGGCRDNTSSF
jgi:hypothetical protein